MYVSLVGKVLPGLSMSTLGQGDMEGGEAGDGGEGPPFVEIPLWDFQLEQSCNESLWHTFDHVRVSDGPKIHPNVVLSHLYVSVVNNRLYQVMQDTQTKEEMT